MTGIVWPSGGKDTPRVTSEFNPARRNPVTWIVQPHNGIDLIGFTYNRAPEDGRVTVAGYNGGAGIEVRIVADGPTAFHRGTTYRILHNAPNSLRVSVGDRVTAGQIVGTMGTTGQSTGIHCHFETHPGSSWNPTNPRDYMAAALASPAGGGGGSLPTEWDDMANREEVKAALREVLAEPGGQMYANVAFLAEQANGWVSKDRPAEGQLATAISRVTEILYAVDGRADPRIKDAAGVPVKRALAAFLESRPEAPSSDYDVDETAIIEGVLAGLSSDLDALVTIVKALPAETIAALKAAL